MEVRCRLRVMLAEIPMKQQELLKELERLGYHLSAAALSQIVSGKTEQPELKTALAITKALQHKRPGTRLDEIWYLSTT